MTRKWGEHPNDGRGLERISARLKAEQLPSKDKLLIELRGWHTLKGADCFRQAADEIETLRRKLDTCGLECSAGLNRLAAENERLRTCLTGISTCSTCEACRGAAKRALGEVTCRAK